MNPALIRLLKWTPGIIRTRQDLVRGEIDPSDFTRLLTMTEPTCNLKEGEWAQVRKGLYKGDVGLVVAVENWGVEVLLLPRLNPPVSSFNLKRKRSLIPPKPALFDPAEFSRTHEIDPKKSSGNNSYIVSGLKFEYGLLQKGYDFHSVSSTVLDIPSEFFFLYESSRHPALNSIVYPCLREWSFEEGKLVTILTRGYRRRASVCASGTLTGLGDRYVEVDLGSELGVQQYPYQQVQKDIKIGDFVIVGAGSHAGRTGWVHYIDQLDHDVVGIVETSTNDPVIGSNPPGTVNVRPSSYLIPLILLTPLTDVRSSS